MQTDQELAAYIGLDWGDQRHAVQLQAASGGPVEQLELEHRPDMLHAWVAQLRQRFGGRPVGVAIEQCKGAVIHALMQYEFLILYPVNPKALARYREVFAPSGAKDDPTDAALLLDLVRTHRAQLRPWQPDTVTARKLALLCEHRRKLVNRGGALTNRLTSLLKQYFPHALDWVGTLDSRQACDFLAKWPTLAAVQRARPATVRRFYQQHNCRRAAVIAARLADIATAQPLTTDPAIVDTLSLAVQAYAAQLRPLLDAVRTFDGEIATLFADHPDHDLFASFPGAGPVCAPRLAYSDVVRVWCTQDSTIGLAPDRRQARVPGKAGPCRTRTWRRTSVSIGGTNGTRCNSNRRRAARWSGSISSSGPTCCTPGWPTSGSGLGAGPWGLPSNSAKARSCTR